MNEHGGGDPAALRTDDPWQESAVAGWFADQQTERTQPEHLPAAPRSAPEGYPEVPRARDGSADASAAVGPTAKAPITRATDAPITQTPAAGTPDTDTTSAATAVVDRAALYVEVQASPEFGEVRDRYRRFVFPATAAFIVWYLLYVVAATTAPGLMARQLSGPLNVALAAGLAQFATTFLLTWAYARHARLRRDRAALDLRWTLATRSGQERLR
ncbi:DUF485 domain-containing protein [Actinacidiphila sp. DG2A-62]|uniref:DUF485 domain-containing protein n=1 Tax=Actinacidiphila sp. DG2A-62 TaxID=3108821 RepID=UPI002DBF6222|nr:DUF485 domain-containing protein [Actinacidiphila sp. DG2A-62]MEC3997588.1 DUF485 domain-containing protein [Actinacidiphila sp. DG2A-62]